MALEHANVKQQASERVASKYVGMRLNAEDQRNLEAIIAAGEATTASDAIRFGLKCGAEKVKK